MEKQKLVLLSPLVLLLVPFAMAQQDTMRDGNVYLIRDQFEHKNMITMAVILDGDDSVMADGFFIVSGHILEAHDVPVKFSNDRLTMLGKTITNDQFFAGYEKSTGILSYEFWIDGEQHTGKSEARIERL